MSEEHEQLEQVNIYKDNVAKLVRRGQDISLETYENKLRVLLDFFQKYYESDSARMLVEQYSNDITRSYSDLKTYFDKAIGDEAWNEQLKQQYINSIDSANNIIRQQNILALVNSSYASDYLNNNQLINELKELKDNAKKAQAEVQNIAKNARKSLTEQISASDGKAFLDDSERYGKIANRWLTVSGVFAFLTFVPIAWLFVAIIIDSNYVINNTSQAIFKVFAALFLIYILQVSLRNYNANKHLQIVNKQRATILAFIDTFSKSLSSPDYKDYLITYASKTVFDHGESGFITRNYGAGSNDNNGLDELINIIKRQP